MPGMLDRDWLATLRNFMVMLFPATITLESSPYRLGQLALFPTLLFSGLTLGIAFLLFGLKQTLKSGPFNRLIAFNILCFMAYGTWAYHFYEIDLVHPKFWMVYGGAVLVGNSALWNLGTGLVWQRFADISLIGIGLATLLLVPGNLDLGEATSGGKRTGAAPNNIYYFIFDAHPGLALDHLIPAGASEKMAQELAKLGFASLASPSSNYAHTNQTLAAVMSLDYLPEGDVSQKQLYPESVQRGTPPLLILSLRRQGYRTYSMPSAAFGCMTVHFRCILPTQSLGFRAAFGSLVSQTPLRNWKRFAQSVRAINAIQIALREQLLLMKTGEPFFLFVHHLSPHPPYHYSANCIWENDLDPSRLGSGWAQADRPSFVAETLCLNRDIVRMAQTLVARDPSAIVILQSDHGPWLGKTGQAGETKSRLQFRRERLSFLNFVRLPENCLPDKAKSFGQVNTARLLVACVSGKPADFLPEKSYFTDISTGQSVRVK